MIIKKENCVKCNQCFAQDSKSECPFPFPGCGGPDRCNAEDDGFCPGCSNAEDWTEEGEHDD